MTELKPCPFCGNDGSGDYSLSYHVNAMQVSSVVCNQCGAYGPDPDISQSGIQAWNNRASLAEQQPPADGEMTKAQPHYSEGVCSDGAAILRDGVMMPIEEIVSELNRLTVLPKSQPPVDGEVAELVAWLHGQDGGREQGAIYSRIADLMVRFSQPPCLVVNPSPGVLEALKAMGPGRIELLPAEPQPIPVSERWPEFSDSDDDERVWCLRLSRIRQGFDSHWLPAHALPLPSEEATP